MPGIIVLLIAADLVTGEGEQLSVEIKAVVGHGIDEMAGASLGGGGGGVSDGLSAVCG